MASEGILHEPPGSDNAKTSIHQLLKQLDVKHIVSVDDAYRATVEQISDLIVESPQRAKLVKQLETLLVVDVPQDVVRANVARRLDGIDAASMEDIRELLTEEWTGDGGQDLYELAQLFEGSGIRYERLSLHAWRRRYSDLSKLGPGGRTLVLFDEDFHEEHEAKDAGLRAIQELLKGTTSEKVITGLLTSTCEVGDECHKWEQVAKSYHLDRNRFLYIAKKRLDHDIMGFALMLKLTALSPGCSELLEELCSLAEESFQEATYQCRMNVTIYDFEHIVFALSRHEGIWEPDTVLRMMHIYLRGIVGRKVRKEPAVQSLVDRIRAVSQIDTTPQDKTPHTSWKIQRLEMYDDGEFVNSMCLPLELGDIFLRPGLSGGNDKIYVLIAQPCDFMVRGNGEREGRAAEEAVLCQVMAKGKGQFELKYWEETNGDSAAVNLGTRITVDPCMLDLAVFSEAGETKLSLNDKPSPRLIPAWNERFRRLQKRTERIIKNYEAVKAKQVPDELAKLVLPSASVDGKLRPVINTASRSIDFGFKRVGRIRHPWSGDLLKAYALHWAREAYEMDLGRDG